MSRINLETIFSLGYKSEYPQRQLILGYAAYSILGSLLLLLPLCRAQPVSVIDNVFTAVSALSTTGLSTVDVSSFYTFWGQLVILALIQIGGLGYMTFSSYVMLRLTKHLGSNEARMFNAQFAFPNKKQNETMLGNIVNFSISFELMGVVLLYPYFLIHDVESPLWSAIFHSVSAFCTAGFSIYSDNLMRFQFDWYVSLVIAMLSYMGAMGFIMMTDVFNKLRNWRYRISFTTKVIAAITTGMTVWSTLHLYFFEPSIAHLSVGDRLLSSIGICSKIVLILLMFIGRVGVITLGNVMLVRAHSRDVKHRSDLVV